MNFQIVCSRETQFSSFWSEYLLGRESLSLPMFAWSQSQLKAFDTLAPQVSVYLLSRDNQAGAVVLMQPGPDAVEILYLETLPSYQGQGLMDELLAHISLREKGPIWLEVHEANNAAHRLYQKHGFVEVGRRPHYYRDGGAAILMTRS